MDSNDSRSKPKSSNQKLASKTKRRKKKKKSHKGTWICIVLLLGIAILVGLEFQNQLDLWSRHSSTYLDSISITDLAYTPQESYEQSIEVGDMTVYGNTLIFYAQEYDPLVPDGFYGRVAQLRNIETGAWISTTFTGGIDSGFDLQSLPQGVYELYLSDEYTPKRAYVSQAIAPIQLFTVRDHDQVKSIQLSANTNYLGKFNIFTDKPYLYISVTQQDPIAHYVDIVLDPSGTLAFSEEDDPNDQYEAQLSWALANQVKAYLENAGLRVEFSQDPQENLGYLGSPSRLSTGYQNQAKIFLSLSMDYQEYNYPYCVSSPLSNGLLGNALVQSLKQEGVTLANVSLDSQLNTGNSYDNFFGFSYLSTLPILRESGGKATGAGLLGGWEENALFSNANGMAAVAFYYASAVNESSLQYYLDHQDSIAKGLAQGILEYIGLDQMATLPIQTESNAQNSLEEQLVSKE